MGKELETALEDRCVKRIEQRGGLALKLKIDGVRGFPDRTILMPGKPVWFAEFKRLKSGRVSAQQLQWEYVLQQRGLKVYFIETDQQFADAMAKEIYTP